MRLIESKYSESNKVTQSVSDGATFNYYALYKKNGALYGATATKASDTKVSITEGVLVVRGYRVEFEGDEVLLNYTGIPLPTGTRSDFLYLRITKAGDDATVSFYRSENPSGQYSDTVERSDGMYDFKIAKIELDSNGIVKVNNAINNITPTGGTSGASAASVPAPQLELIYGADKHKLDAVVTIANKAAYDQLQGNFNVRFVFMRYQHRGRYRKKVGGLKKRVFKTGFVQPADAIGWTKRKFKITTNYTELGTHTLFTVAQEPFRVSGVIEKVSDIIDTMYYDTGQEYDAESGRMVPKKKNRQAISNTTNPYFVRLTRSKRQFPPSWLDEGSTSLYLKNNTLRFAYKAQLLSGGNVVAESGIGNIVEIRPNRRHSSVEGNEDYTILNQNLLFTIKIV